MQFDHVGIITTEKHDDEIYVPATKVWVTDFRKHPYPHRVAAVRAGQAGDRPGAPHAARGLSRRQHRRGAKGLKVLLEPFDAGIAVVGFYETPDGGVVEFMEYPRGANERDSLQEYRHGHVHAHPFDACW